MDIEENVVGEYEEDNQPYDIQELTLRLLSSNLDLSQSVKHFSDCVGIEDLESKGAVLSAEEQLEVKGFFKSMMRAARPVTSRLSMDHDLDRSIVSVDATIGSPSLLTNISRNGSLSPISPTPSTEQSLQSDSGMNIAPLESHSLYSTNDESLLSSVDEGELFETMTTLERQTIVRQLEAAERHNQTLKRILERAEVLNTTLKEERDVANDRSAVAEERIREVEQRLEDAKIREQANIDTLQVAPSGEESRCKAELDDKTSQLIACKLELAISKDECDKLQQSAAALEKKLAQVKEALANAKADQEDSEAKCQQALFMQQTALSELNKMRRQAVDPNSS